MMPIVPYDVCDDVNKIVDEINNQLTKIIK